jgi:hypothetical protein
MSIIFCQVAFYKWLNRVQWFVDVYLKVLSLLQRDLENELLNDEIVYICIMQI